jgi:Fic family protein
MYLQSIQQAAENIPNWTKISYGSKQNEFKEFCREEQYDDGCTVHAEKLNHFLVKKVTSKLHLIKQCTNTKNFKVINRPSRKHGKGFGKPVGIQTVKQYVNAVISLYNFQVMMKQNSHPHPRDKYVLNKLQIVFNYEFLNRAITSLLNNLESQTFSRKKALYLDRGIGTLQDGYITVEELKKIANYFMHKTKLSDICDWMAFLLSHYNLL